MAFLTNTPGQFNHWNYTDENDYYVPFEAQGGNSKPWQERLADEKQWGDLKEKDFLKFARSEGFTGPKDRAFDFLLGKTDKTGKIDVPFGDYNSGGVMGPGINSGVMHPLLQYLKKNERALWEDFQAGKHYSPNNEAVPLVIGGLMAGGLGAAALGGAGGGFVGGASGGEVAGAVGGGTLSGGGTGGFVGGATGGGVGGLVGGGAGGGVTAGGVGGELSGVGGTSVIGGGGNAGTLIDPAGRVVDEAGTVIDPVNPYVPPSVPPIDPTTFDPQKWLQGLDWSNILKGVIGGGLGYLGADKMADAYRDVSQQYLNIGAPYRDRLDASYGQNFDLMKQPGYGDAFDRMADISTRAWSAKGGNPANNPGIQGNIMNDVWNQSYLPALSNYRGQLGQFGGMGLNTAGAASLGGANTAGAGFDALGYGVGTAMTPTPNWSDILKNMGGTNYGLTFGGVRY